MKEKDVKRFLFAVGLLTAVALAAAPAGATSLRRAGLDDLVAANRTIVVAEVVDAASYWNAEGTMILTDVRVAPTEVLKGEIGSGLLTVTVQGGTVGDTSVVIVGGAELAVGRSYVLFVDRDELPGVGRVDTVREHSQGVFEIVEAGSGPRAVSAANAHALLPDTFGNAEPPGGRSGLALDELVGSIRQRVQTGARGEVR